MTLPPLHYSCESKLHSFLSTLCPAPGVSRQEVPYSSYGITKATPLRLLHPSVSHDIMCFCEVLLDTWIVALPASRRGHRGREGGWALQQLRQGCEQGLSCCWGGNLIVQQELASRDGPAVKVCVHCVAHAHH